MISDEDGFESYEFKNSEGQTVLVRKVLQESNIQVQTLAPIAIIHRMLTPTMS
jgi:hypothetical protein